MVPQPPFLPFSSLSFWSRAPAARCGRDAPLTPHVAVCCVYAARHLLRTRVRAHRWYAVRLLLAYTQRQRVRGARRHSVACCSGSSFIVNGRWRVLLTPATAALPGSPSSLTVAALPWLIHILSLCGSMVPVYHLIFVGCWRLVPYYDSNAFLPPTLLISIPLFSSSVRICGVARTLVWATCALARSAVAFHFTHTVVCPRLLLALAALAGMAARAFARWLLTGYVLPLVPRA